MENKYVSFALIANQALNIFKFLKEKSLGKHILTLVKILFAKAYYLSLLSHVLNVSHKHLPYEYIGRGDITRVYETVACS